MFNTLVFFYLTPGFSVRFIECYHLFTLIFVLLCLFLLSRGIERVVTTKSCIYLLNMYYAPSTIAFIPEWQSQEVCFSVYN